MNPPHFTINLGNGIYLDSAGRLTTAVDGVASFSLSQPLPIPSSAIQQVFSGLGTVVPLMEKVSGSLDFQVKDLDLLKLLGLSEEFAKTFGKAGLIAETLGSVIPYVNVAVGVLSLIGVFKGSDPLKDLIELEFDRLYARMDEREIKETKIFTSHCVSVFDLALTRLAPYRNTLAKPKKYRGPNEWADTRQELENKLADLEVALGDALTYEWSLPFDPDAYYDNYGSLVRRHSLFTLPKSGTTIPADFPASHVPYDHRPMVQLLIFGIQTYLTVIKALSPEYRTTAPYAFALEKLADKLSSQLDKMRNETLALTIYEAGVPYFMAGPNQWFILGVGAMDLRADSDFSMAFQAGDPHPEWDRAANLYRLWTSAPTVDIRGEEIMVGPVPFWTISPAAVQLANQQSERDYAALLSRSGYFTLAHLEALMRHLATEPNRSETVTGNAETWRKPLDAFPVTVRSEEIPFSPPIEATASREPQDCKAYLTLTTQAFPLDQGIGYRLRLLTLPDGTTEMPFDSYVWNTYIPAGDGSRNWKLQVNENPGLPLDPVGANERLIIDSASPLEVIQQEGTISLTADTFDWYIPGPDNPIRLEQIRDGVRLGINPAYGVGGGPQPIPQPSPPPGAPATAVSRWNIESIVRQSDSGISDFGWDEGGQTWKGEKREWQRTQIELTYKLFWHEDQLSISLKARPDDRNFVVYLIVEEFLIRSQQWLRTPVQVRFNGQLTYVPQSFFDAESKASKHALEVIKHIDKNYTVSREPGPGDPVIGWLRPGTFKSATAMREFVDLASQHAPDIVEQAIAQVGRRSHP